MLTHRRRRRRRGTLWHRVDRMRSTS